MMRIASTLCLVACLAACPGVTAEPPLPQVDTTGMPPPVARAIQTAHARVRANTQDGQAWGLYGSVLDAHELLDQASAAYERAHSLEPREFSWIYLLALARLHAGGGQDEVSPLFDAALALRPDYAPAHFRHGQAQMRWGDTEAARAAYAEAVRLDPELGVAHRGLGQALLALGDAPAAIRELDEAARIDAADSIVHMTLARAWRLAGDEGRARVSEMSAQGLRPRLTLDDEVRRGVEDLALGPNACLRRAEENIAKGEHAAAIDDLEALAEALPENADVCFRLAVCHEATDDLAAAETWLRLALEHEPTYHGARVRLALLLERTGRPAEAARELEPTVEALPNDAELQALHSRLKAAGG